MHMLCNVHFCTPIKPTIGHIANTVSTSRYRDKQHAESFLEHLNSLLTISFTPLSTLQ